MAHVTVEYSLTMSQSSVIHVTVMSQSLTAVFSSFVTLPNGVLTTRRAEQTTAAFRDKMKQRAAIESTLSAAVRKHGARLDEAEIGQQSTHLRHMLGPADERLVGWIVFVDDGRTFFTAVVNQNIHHIAGKKRLLGRADLGHPQRPISVICVSLSVRGAPRINQSSCSTERGSGRHGEDRLLELSH
jgi:hypothetical protein